MTLKNFIKQLQKIAEGVDSRKTEVQMADTIPVVSPVLIDGTVIITDIDPDAAED